MRKRISLAFLTLFLIVFFFAKTAFTADLLAMIFTLLCAVLIFVFSAQGGGRFNNWKMLSLIPLSWFIADLLLFLYTNVFELTTKASHTITFFYFIPNFLMLAPIIMFLFLGFLKLYRAKFFLDLIALSIIFLGIASGVVFSHLDFSKLGTISFTFLIINVETDLWVVVSMLMLLSSVNFKTVDKTIYIIAFSYMVFIYGDFDHLYEFIVDGYHTAFISDYLFYVSFYLMTIGALFANDGEGPLVKGIVQKPENLMSTRIVLYVWLLPLLLFLRDDISLAHLLYISIVVIIHQYVNHIIQRLYKSEMDIVEKDLMMHKLESIVHERTKELKDSNEALYTQLVTDSLTGLHNREYLIDYLETAIDENKIVTLIYMDVDRFKVINDYHGHHIGDKVLGQVARRLESVDVKADVIARIGGDEFALVIPTDKMKKLSSEINKLVEYVKAPIIIDDFRFHLELSIGISRFPQDADNVGELLRYADLAMYHVKNRESNDEFALFSIPMIRKIERRNHLELLLRNADYEKDFLINYQPKFDIYTGNIIGMEALIRWNHPIEGMIFPGEFIQIAEDTGLILGLSDWIFYEAMKQTNVWNRTYKKDLVVSLNVSPISFDSYDFIPGLKKMIEKLGINPTWVELEITENIAVQATSKIEDTFSLIKDMGVQISIDDFGTGYSSLAYMKQFEVDVLKIARELVMNIVDDYKEKLIVKAIITMASGMNNYIIAEGVETEQQLEILKEFGCDAVQGYLLGRPVDKQTFEKLYLK